MTIDGMEMSNRGPGSTALLISQDGKNGCFSVWFQSYDFDIEGSQT
jgi:hypothetical protein